MKQIITISMEMKENEEKVELKFQSGINPIGGVITEEVANKIQEKIADIAKIVSDAIEKDMNKKEEELSEVENFIDFLNGILNIKNMKNEEITDLQKAIYNFASDEVKKEIDEFEENLSKLKTREEKLNYAIKSALKEILGR